MLVSSPRALDPLDYVNKYFVVRARYSVVPEVRNLYISRIWNINRRIFGGFSEDPFGTGSVLPEPDIRWQEV